MITVPRWNQRDAVPHHVRIVAISRFRCASLSRIGAWMGTNGVFRGPILRFDIYIARLTRNK